MKKHIIVLIVVAVVVGGAAFYGGMVYGKSEAAPTGAAAFVGRGGFAGRGGVNVAMGQIISAGDGTVTLQLRNSSSTKIVLFSTSTPVMKTVSVTSADLQTGTQITVAGTANSDGSMTAQSIDIGNGFGVGQSFGGERQTVPAASGARSQ